MAKYRINGSNYEVDDALQGDELNSTLTQLADVTAKQNQEKFLTFIGQAEGAKEDTIVGGKLKVTDFSAHPNIVGLRTADGPSTAAGQFQITNTTWREMAPQVGATDFSLESQKKVALALIKRRGAEDDVMAGDFNGAISKLGKEWASLPSSPYGQSKRSQAWVDAALGGKPPAESPVAAPYKPFAAVRKDVDPDSLNADTDWIRASKEMFKLRTSQSFKGEDGDAAEWGKELMGWSDGNTVAFARYGRDVIVNGTQSQKAAMLYMMETTSDQQYSWGGTGRFLKAAAIDPANWASVASLGIGGAAKIAAASAARMGLMKALATSLGRTGIVAGIDTGIQMGVVNSVAQSIKVDAGAQKEFSGLELAGHVGAGAVLGTVLGTAGDAAVASIINTVRRNLPKKAGTAARVEPSFDPVAPAGAPLEAPPVVPAVDGAMVLAQQNNTFTGQSSSAGRSVGMTQHPDTPIDQLFSNFADELKLDPKWRDRTGRGRTREAAEKEGMDEFRAGMLKRADSRAKNFQNEKELESTVPFRNDGSTANVWTTEGGVTQVRFLSTDGTLLGAARMERGLIDSVASTEAGKGGTMGKDMLLFLNENKIANIHEVPDRSPGYVKSLQAARTELDARAAAAHQVASAVPPPGGHPDLLPETLLTEAQLREGTQRGQVGRLWPDDLPPVHPADHTAGAAIDIPNTGEGMRSTPRANAGTLTAGEHVVGQLRGLDDKELAGVLEHFRTGAYTLEDHASITASVMLYAKEVIGEQLTLMRALELSTNAKETGEIVAKLSAIDERLVPLSLANEAMGSLIGSMLQQRKLDPFAFKGMTVDSLMAEKGLSRKDASELFVKLHEGATQDAVVAKIASEYDVKIQAALQAGDNKEAARLTSLKQREIDGLVERDLPQSASFMHQVSEWVISAVFSPTTIAFNIVAPALKTIIRPALHALVTDPLQAATRIEMAATYSAMRTTFGGSMRAAKAAYLYEQSLLTRGTGMLMEGELAIKGRTGGVVRFLPRILNATDEFLSHVNYNGFVAGKAAASALIEGQGKGMTGKILNDYVTVSTEIALQKSLVQKSGEALLQPLVNKGVNLGLTGEALQAYVERHAAKNVDALRHGNDKEALDLTRDVLYKRDFSGEGTLSGIAKSYQDAANKSPSLKLIVGQIFFRTPVRVFEEGMRLMPGVQFFAPGFIGDLKGANGINRQARAQAEALSAVAITGAVVSMYAQGLIKGDGAPDNWKQARTASDGPGQPDNSIKMSDGSYWVYRNLDPIATPIKILINGLDRLDKLQIRQAQGEFTDKRAEQQVLAYLTVGTSAVLAAIKDANLTQGVANIIKLFDNLNDPEGKEDAWLKFFGEKISWAVPNTFNKVAKTNDPRLTDPATFWQIVESRLAALHVDVPDVKSSFSYDVLGNVRSLADTGVLWNIFSTDTPVEQARGMSLEGQEVMTGIAALQKETGVVISTPSPKHPETGSLDLRTMMTEDKKETMFDRWQANYKALDPDKVLLPIIQSEAPVGTHDQHGMKVKMLQAQMKSLQDMAFQQLMVDERIQDRMIRERERKATASAGLFDLSNRSK